ncbi:MAG TPA: hypothetical protein VNQ90_15570 [Chthoniobacteraceae bacterium]|nr:hypothetical protein [Chthoniobacteraceae bacterium]
MAQPKGIFVGLTGDQINAIREKAVLLIMEGKTTMSGSVAGQSFSKQLALPLDQILLECNYASELLSNRPRPRRVLTNFNRALR